jgi:hypothetical protein
MPDPKQLAALIEASRQRDAHQSLRYHSRVSTSHKYVCMTVPKIACSRIKLSLHQLEGQPPPDRLGQIHGAGRRLADFETTEIVEMITAPDWFRFCFVRNPYDRLLSAYKTQVGNTWNPEYDRVKRAIKKTFRYPTDAGGPQRIVAFRDFVRYLHEAEDAVRRDGHFNRQTNILMPDLIRYDLVGRFENFAADFECVLRRLNAPPEILATASEVKNATYKLHPAIAYDRDLAGLAYDLYKPDFENFGYDPDSWMFDHE